MRLPSACVLLPLFAQYVLGSVLAGPYQSMLLWYAYRMQILVNGPGQNRIAPNCHGNGPGHTCLFDEFLKDIKRTGRKLRPWTGHTSVGTNLNPPVLDTADELAASTYDNNFDPHKVFPGAFQAANPRLDAIMNAAIDSIQTCRRQLDDGQLSEEIDNCRRAMVSIHEARRADMAEGIIRIVNSMLNSNGYDWGVETKPNTAPDGSRWPEIDTAATMRVHPDATSDLRESIEQVVADYPTMDENPWRDPNAGQREQRERPSAHYNAVMASQRSESRLLGDPNC